MASVTTEREALWLAVLADQADAAPKAVYADWLMERGLDADLVRGLLWCAKRGKWPRTHNRKGYIWQPGDHDMMPWIKTANPDAPFRIPFYLWSLVSQMVVPGGGHRAAKLDTLVRRLGRVLGSYPEEMCPS